MNDSDKAMILIAIFGTALIIGLGVIPNVYGFDYISAQGSLWAYEPKVCIDRTVNESNLWYTLRAADAWETVMNDYGYHNFNYTMYLVEGSDLQETGFCDILIQYGEPAQYNGHANSIGVANCLVNGPVMYSCHLVIKNDPLWYYNTVTHELGHAFGLGHRLPFNQTGFAGVVISNDIMNAQAGLFERITKHNVDFLIDHYHEDGWGLPNAMPQNYTIPHP